MVLFDTGNLDHTSGTIGLPRRRMTHFDFHGPETLNPSHHAHPEAEKLRASQQLLEVLLLHLSDPGQAFFNVLTCGGQGLLTCWHHNAFI